MRPGQRRRPCRPGAALAVLGAPVWTSATAADRRNNGRTAATWPQSGSTLGERGGIGRQAGFRRAPDEGDETKMAAFIPSETGWVNQRLTGGGNPVRDRSMVVKVSKGANVQAAGEAGKVDMVRTKRFEAKLEACRTRAVGKRALKPHFVQNHEQEPKARDRFSARCSPNEGLKRRNGYLNPRQRLVVYSGMVYVAQAIGSQSAHSRVECHGDEIGKLAALRTRCSKGLAGSSPARGTIISFNEVEGACFQGRALGRVTGKCRSVE